MSDVTPHIVNIGRMVEDMENKIRNTLNDIYFGNYYVYFLFQNEPTLYLDHGL